LIQGDDHDYYFAIGGQEGNSMPPYDKEWQKFTTTGYNVGSDDFVVVNIVCTECEETSAPSETPTHTPTENPTLSPTCYENYIVVIGCCDKDFEGIYERQEENKNGKIYYVHTNGYTLYYVHDGTFDNHWVSQSPDMDYLYIIEQTWEGDEPLIGDGMEWNEYRGGKFFDFEIEVITIRCVESFDPTNVPTNVPSPVPTSAPTRGPSPYPTIYPTNIPSPRPSLNPSPSPSPAPSVLPTPTPTNLPTSSIPTPSPSLMPSPSPTDYPTTLTPTAESVTPTLAPTSSPTKSPSDWCRCIFVNSN
jgi:hypothetical protein